MKQIPNELKEMPKENFPEKGVNNMPTFLDHKFEVEITRVTGPFECIRFKSLLNVKEAVQAKKDIDEFCNAFLPVPKTELKEIEKQTIPVQPAQPMSLQQASEQPQQQTLSKPKRTKILSDYDGTGSQFCPFCKTGCWDNRENKKFPKSPDFKCKNTDCGAGSWINETELGQKLNWQK